MKVRSKSSIFYQRNPKSNGNNNALNFKVKQGRDGDDKRGQLHQDKVPQGLREPYIITGYRKPYITTKESLQSIFHINNETFNIWSHVVALLFFIVRYSVLLLELRKASSSQRDFYYPMLSSAIGSWTVYAMSSVAHIFNSKSEHLHHVFYFFDYAGISIYTHTSGQVMYFYNRPINTGWQIFESALLYTVIGASLSFLSTFLSCLSKCTFKNFKTYGSMARVLSVFAGWLNTILPLAVSVTLCSCHALTTCQSFLACNDLLITYFQRHCFYTIVGAIIYGTRLPERLLPGKFDIIGNSHHFLHVFGALSTEYAFKILEVALESRRVSANEHLAKSLVGITSTDTLLPTLIVFVGNMAIACCFASSVYKTVE